MKLYKLTNQNDRTYGGCQWGENVTVTTSGTGELCTDGYTHWYTDPLLAVLFNPLHGQFNLATAHLWEGEGDAIKTDNLKVGCSVGTTIRRVELPKITTEQYIRFAILCAKRACDDVAWNTWADKWLSGEDRSDEAARAAELAARAAASAAELAAASAAALAAELAARAAALVAARAVELSQLDLHAIAREAVEG